MSMSIISSKRRFSLLVQYNFTCQLCGKSGTDGRGLQIDHKVPEALGGKNTDDNLWVLCAPCNQGKSDQSWDSIEPHLPQNHERPDVLELAKNTLLAEGWIRREDHHDICQRVREDAVNFKIGEMQRQGWLSPSDAEKFNDSMFFLMKQLEREVSSRREAEALARPNLFQRMWSACVNV